MRIQFKSTAIVIAVASATLVLAGCQKKAEEAPAAAAAPESAAAPAPTEAAAPPAAATAAEPAADPNRNGPGMGLKAAAPATAAPATPVKK